MFLIESLGVIFCIYWISAVIAETVMDSDNERVLSPGVKVGFGFLLSLVYFSGMCLIISASQAWILGIIFLILYAYSTKNLININQLKPYFKTSIIFLLGGLLFFAPLLIANNYGPFTEGGGDISIYADTAKFIHDKNLTELGQSANNFSEIIHNVKQTLIPKSLEERWDSINHGLINPPAAESAAYRVIATQDLNIFFSLPYVAYGFLGGDTNYSVYFGIQAFFYVCMLSGVWYFFRRFNFPIANVAIFVLIASHGITSVFYNMYSMQGNCLAIAALVLSILPSINLFSRAGFRTYGSALLIIWLSYIHFLSVVMPLIIGITFFTRPKTLKTKIYVKNNLFFITAIISIIFIGIGGLAAWVGAMKSLGFLQSLLADIWSHGQSVYRGDGLSILSFEWLSFLFGFLSQQHFLPFASEYPSIHTLMLIGITAGIITLLAGFFIMLRLLFSTISLNGTKKLYFSIYLLAILTVFIQCYLACQSLYTQAKGAQNVQVYFYLIMLLPFALGLLALKENAKIRKWIGVYCVVFVIFTATLFTTQIAYVMKLATNQDRSSILEFSYFSEAERIKKEDSTAYVLVEPRKSADTYIGIQPFFGNRMVTTRHLVLQTETFHPTGWIKQTVLAPDIIETNDLSHLWTLTSSCQSKWQWPHKLCRWQATKIINNIHPKLLLFADDYEINYGKRTLSKEDPSLNGMFSYLRNGLSVLFLPKGHYDIEAIIQPRDSSEYLAILSEVSNQIKKGELGKNVTLSNDGLNIKLNYLFLTHNPTLKLITRLNKEYWLNVKINEEEIS